MSQHVLITAGPTREYLDGVRYLSNASSGRMGYALAAAAAARGWGVTLVSGPVESEPPPGVELVRVITGEEMLAACRAAWPASTGLIAAAAVCDYRPTSRLPGKMAKQGRPLVLELRETADIVRELGSRKDGRWIVGFAVEAIEQTAIPHEPAQRGGGGRTTSTPTRTLRREGGGGWAQARERALRKLADKHCDAMALNAAEAIGADRTRIELLDAAGLQEVLEGSKIEAARRLIEWIAGRFAR